MPSRKRVAATVKIRLEAGQASPGKVGQALGPHGVNIGAVIAAYNTASAARRGMVVPVVVTVYDDRSFDLQLRTPPTSACWPARPACPRAAAARAPTAPSPSSAATGCARSPGPSCPS
jgi:hypothetical protein